MQRRFFAWFLVGSISVAACARGTIRRVDTPGRDYPAGVVDLVWRQQIREQRLAKNPGECAVPAVAGDRLVVGSRTSTLVALDKTSGRTLWRTSTPGGVDSEARFDAVLDTVFVGTDEGLLLAVDPATGATRWSFRAKGAVERAVERAQDMLFFTSAEDRLYALDARTGKQLWQYEREAPATDEFTIRGHSGARFWDGRVYVGFSDGFLVALGAQNGDVLWARSLASASELYVDVDSTPTPVGKAIVASSYSGGLYALDAITGEVRWRLGIEGAGTASRVGERLYFAAPRDGFGAITPQGHFIWRQGLADAGELSPPVAAGPYLLFTGTRAGLFVVDRVSGALLEIWNPGRGICGSVTLDAAGDMAYVLATNGELLAFRILPPLP